MSQGQKTGPVLGPSVNLHNPKISKCYKSALRTIAQEKENQESKESHKIEETEISVWETVEVKFAGESTTVGGAT